MKVYLTLIFTGLLITSVFCQNHEYGAEFFVINILGAKVYEKPTFKSKALTEFKVGENIIVEKIVEAHEEMEIGTGFSLAGYWIKPTNVNGFVFSSDLSDKNPEIEKSKYGQIKINLLGKLIDKKQEQKLTIQY